MPIRTARPANDVRQMMDHVCDRQSFAELRPGSGDDEGDPVRVRFSRVEGKQLHMLATPSVDPSKTPLTGHTATIQFVMDGHSCGFHSVVRRIVTVMGPGARPRVAELVLSLPEKITRRHRRSAYRIPVAAHDAIPVSICQASAEYGDCSTLNARHARGRMVNLSAGGICAIVHVDRSGAFQEGERVFVEFQLPGQEEEFILLSEVRHIRKVHDGAGVLVGLRFQSGVVWPVEPMLQTITQFVTREERRRLRRRR